MNIRLSVGGIFCDLEKAFVCVNHGILVDKLEFYGIGGKFLTLIQSYFRDRYQKVLTDKINACDSVSSRWQKKVTNGVPQGSVLDSLLFLICINDLPKITDNYAKVVLFADDTSIIVTNSNQGGLQRALNKTFSDMISWFKASFLLLNFNKLYYLEFRTKNCTDTTLGINYFNKSIAVVIYTKFLGLVSDDTLSWDNHIDQLISRLNSACYTIRAVKAMLSRTALRMLYFSYAHFVTSYGIIFWCNISNSIKILRIKKKCKNYN